MTNKEHTPTPVPWEIKDTGREIKIIGFSPPEEDEHGRRWVQIIGTWKYRRSGGKKGMSVNWYPPHKKDIEQIKLIVKAVNTHAESREVIREIVESANKLIEHYRIVNRPIESHMKTAGVVLLDNLENCNC